nr:ATP phosphoribosyltransferase [Klebsiella pneumoniae]
MLSTSALSAKMCWKKSCSAAAPGEDPRYFTLRRLDFGGCRLSLATPVDEAGTARRRWTANVSPPLTRTC